MAAVDVPHLAWPLRLSGPVGLLPDDSDIPGDDLTPQSPGEGSFSVVEQDTIDDVTQCVHVLVRTPLGYRALAPDVGLADPLWADGMDADQLVQALTEWEPRATITVEATPVDDPGRQTVTVHVDLASEA